MQISILYLFYYIPALAGLYVVFDKIYKALKARFTFKAPYDFMSAYKGQNSWAVVTGASDGIGQGFVEELAKLGLNSVLISRTESKLANKCKELKERFPDREFRYQAKDFTKGGTLSFYQEILRHGR